MNAPKPVQTLRFLRRGQPVTLHGVAPDRTLLQVLREDLHLTAAKEGCGEGDCGACTVVLGEAVGGKLQYKAINSCIRLAHSVHGMAVWTAEDIAERDQPAAGQRPASAVEHEGHTDPAAGPPQGGVSPLGGQRPASAAERGGHTDPAAGPPQGGVSPPGGQRPASAAERGGHTDPAAGPPPGGVSPPGGQRPASAAERGGPCLHPAQEAMVQCHGSQCGFCTPGFVMSLFGMYQNTGGGQGISRERAQADLSGNLCRCTGYRPILDAALLMGSLPLPAGCAVDEAATLAALRALQTRGGAGAAANTAADAPYLRPTTLQALLQARTAHPKAQVVAGTTDVGLWITKQHQRYDRVLDLTATRELRRIERYPHHIAIGAAVSLTDAFAALAAEWPQLQTFGERFAGLPVRNSGTLGGNVANGSPIGDSMPLLIALGASVVLMRWKKGKTGGEMAHRELRLEDLYTGYRTNVMRPDELLCWIKVPRPSGRATGTASGRARPANAAAAGSTTAAAGRPAAAAGVDAAPPFVRVYKISKRFDDDISAVCLALNLQMENGVVRSASIGAGGVAATPARARQTEAALLGQPWTADTVMAATAVLRAEFQPISDMRASAAYRQTVLGNLLQRAWLESQGLQNTNLESLKTLEALT